MRHMFDEFERFTGTAGIRYMPTMEIMHRDDKLIVNVDLPGLTPEDISVRVEHGAMVIEGERRNEHEDSEGDVVRCERSYGQFQRVIPLPEGVDVTTAEARFENGVVEVTLRAPVAKPSGHKLEIKTGASRPDKSQQH